MPIKDVSPTNNKSHKPKYKSDSKMTKYNIIFDDELNQYRCGFYKNKLKEKELTENDISWRIEAGYEHRLDLISMKFYDTSIYDWAISDYNNIENPIKDIVVGKQIIIPSRSKIS